MMTISVSVLIGFSIGAGCGLLGLVAYAIIKRSEKVFHLTDCVMATLAVILLIWPALGKINIANVISVEIKKGLSELKSDMASLNDKMTDLRSKIRDISTSIEKLDTKIDLVKKATVSEVLKVLQREGVQLKAFPKLAPTGKTLPEITPPPEDAHKTTPDISEPPLKSPYQSAPKERIKPELKR